MLLGWLAAFSPKYLAFAILYFHQNILEWLNRNMLSFNKQNIFKSSAAKILLHYITYKGILIGEFKTFSIIKKQMTIIEICATECIAMVH